jgi:hypothetical protein
MACESPVEPSSTEDPITITNIVNIDNGNNGCQQQNCGDNGTDPQPNRSPFITPVPSQTNDVGDSVFLTVTATDPDEDNLDWSWEANSAPRNLTLQPNGNTAFISGTISSSSANDSPFTVRLFVNDGKVEVSSVFLWTVNAPS